MAKIENFKRLRSKLNTMEQYSKVHYNESVTVGFSQSYAIWVHERPARHAKGKHWKFLEIPATLYERQMAEIAATVMSKTKSMIKALMAAGHFLQGQAQGIVPRDTGALAASAYTCKTENDDEVAARAYIRSQLLKRRKEDERREKRSKK